MRMSDREFICPVNLANSDGEIKAPLVLHVLGLKTVVQRVRLASVLANLR